MTLTLPETQALANRLREQLAQVVFGQPLAIELLLVGLFSEGHVLIEGIPGTAKTTLVKTLAQLIHMDFRRVQLTPDLLPAEITGTSLYDLNTRAFVFKPGPVFTDLLLADEINRTPPKTQSALLEAMEERQVTVDGLKNPLSPLFTVIATLNPVEFEGTYPLPEAQMDRFMMKIVMGYPPTAAEKTMLARLASPNPLETTNDPLAVATRDEILAARQALSLVKTDDSMLDYILGLIQDTRQHPSVELGCSPRAALSLLAASRAYAALNGYDFITPDHVKAVAPAVMRHRLILSPEAALDNLSVDDIILQTLNKVPVPR